MVFLNMNAEWRPNSLNAVIETTLMSVSRYKGMANLAMQCGVWQISVVCGFVGYNH